MGIDLGVVISIAFDPAVEVDIYRYEGTEGVLFKAHFHLLRVIGIEQQLRLVTDQVYRCFIQSAVERNVAGYPTPGSLPKVIDYVCRRQTCIAHLIRKAKALSEAKDKVSQHFGKKILKELPNLDIGQKPFLIKQIDSLWAFLEDSGAEATNNRAERVLHFGVLWRKRSKGRDIENLYPLFQLCYGAE